MNEKKNNPATSQTSADPETSEAEQEPFFNLGFVRGVSPDKWKKRWEEVRYRKRMLLVPHNGFRDVKEPVGDVDIVRVAEGSRPKKSEPKTGARHAVELYTEALALVLPKEHELAKETEFQAADLDLIQLIGYPNYDERWPKPLEFDDPSWAPKGERQALELVTAGLGGTLLPMPLARAITSKHDHRMVPVVGLPSTTIFAAWPVADDNNEIQEFIGVLRGRRSSSSRNTASEQPASKPAPKKRRKRR